MPTTCVEEWSLPCPLSEKRREAFLVHYLKRGVAFLVQYLWRGVKPSLSTTCELKWSLPCPLPVKRSEAFLVSFSSFCAAVQQFSRAFHVPLQSESINIIDFPRSLKGRFRIVCYFKLCGKNDGEYKFTKRFLFLIFL